MICPRLGSWVLWGLTAVGLAVVAPRQSKASFIVERGWDLLQTISPGTNFLGIEFKGDPLGAFDFTADGDFGRGIGVKNVGMTDTIIKRHNTALLGGPGGFDVIPVEIIALQLVSVNPIDIGAGMGFHWVTLQSERGGPASTGRMTIHSGAEPAGPPPAQPVHGTFDSFFDVFVDLRLGSPNGPIVYSDGFQLISQGVPWSHYPPEGAVQIDGVNRHLNGTNRDQDFWPIGPFQEAKPGVAVHKVKTTTPEPSTLCLGLVGGLIVIVARRRQARRQV